MPPVRGKKKRVPTTTPLKIKKTPDQRRAAGRVSSVSRVSPRAGGVQLALGGGDVVPFTPATSRRYLTDAQGRQYDLVQSPPGSPTPLVQRKSRQQRRSMFGFDPRIVELDPTTDRTVIATPPAPPGHHARRVSVASSTVSSLVSMGGFMSGNIVSSTRIATPPPVTDGGQFVRPRTPETATRVRTRTPETSTRVRTRTPGAATRVRTRTPGAATRVRTSTPEAATRVRTRTPETSTRVRTRTPGAATRVRTRTPGAATRVRTSTPEAATRVRTRTSAKQISRVNHSSRASTFGTDSRRSPVRDYTSAVHTVSSRSPEAESDLSESVTPLRRAMTRRGLKSVGDRSMISADKPRPVAGGDVSTASERHRGRAAAASEYQVDRSPSLTSTNRVLRSPVSAGRITSTPSSFRLRGSPVNKTSHALRPRTRTPSPTEVHSPPKSRSTGGARGSARRRGGAGPASTRRPVSAAADSISRTAYISQRLEVSVDELLDDTEYRLPRDESRQRRQDDSEEESALRRRAPRPAGSRVTSARGRGTTTRTANSSQGDAELCRVRVLIGGKQRYIRLDNIRDVHEAVDDLIVVVSSDPLSYYCEIKQLMENFFDVSMQLEKTRIGKRKTKTQQSLDKCTTVAETTLLKVKEDLIESYRNAQRAGERHQLVDKVVSWIRTAVDYSAP